MGPALFIVISHEQGSLKTSPPGGCAGLDRPCRFDPMGPDRQMKGGCQHGVVTEGDIRLERSADDEEEVVTASDLIARISADRRAGRETSADVRTFLEIVGQQNRAALERLGMGSDLGDQPRIVLFECPDGQERVRLRGGTLDGELYCAHRPRADIWIHSQSVGGTIKWRQRYRCVGHESVEDPEYGTLQVMSFQELVDETEDPKR
jgi:hypothetical protein